MKTKILLIITFVSILFSACELTGSNDSTPDIQMNILSNKDTLYIYPTYEGGVYQLDTVYVGDTVLFQIALNAFYNQLTSFYITLNDTASAKILYPTVASMDTIISIPSSNISKGQFEFKTGQNFVYFPVRYIPILPGNTTYIDFYLSSDAKFEHSIGYNSVSFRVKTPIAEKATE